MGYGVVAIYSNTVPHTSIVLPWTTAYGHVAILVTNVVHRQTVPLTYVTPHPTPAAVRVLPLSVAAV